MWEHSFGCPCTFRPTVRPADLKLYLKPFPAAPDSTPDHLLYSMHFLPPFSFTVSTSYGLCTVQYGTTRHHPPLPSPFSSAGCPSAPRCVPKYRGEGGGDTKIGKTIAQALLPLETPVVPGRALHRPELSPPTHHPLFRMHTGGQRNRNTNAFCWGRLPRK